ncbi:hypothetical protein ATK36_4863 [Amycolatopsis sulphurea]|uniref:Uncharacterized protein n=1 Tax=Amycolatopsis sulphurea TaxID=76022 RepID=A0A2A9FG08_9PSEU|nr:hypothetical protein ATK36_4863 [Amycolatopsis sulphurea]
MSNSLAQARASKRGRFEEVLDALAVALGFRVPDGRLELRVEVGQVLVERVGDGGGGGEVAAQRPGDPNQVGHHLQVDEVVAGDGLSAEDVDPVRPLWIQGGVDAVLEVEHCDRHRAGRFAGWVPGRGKPGGAGGALGFACADSASEPALCGVQAGGAPLGMTAAVPEVDWVVAGRALVIEVAAVLGAGKHDRQPPGSAPRAAECPAKFAVLTGQAGRAVASGPGEQPPVEVGGAAPAIEAAFRVGRLGSDRPAR